MKSSSLYLKSTSSGPNFSLSGAVDAWYGGKEKYNFNTPGWQPGSGNFTQLVWADSENFGIAASQGKVRQKFIMEDFLSFSFSLERSTSALDCHHLEMSSSLHQEKLLVFRKMFLDHKLQ